MKKSPITYPDILVSDFLKMYPQLKISKGHCDYCERPLISDIPFIDGVFSLGLESAPCTCGQGTCRPRSFILLDKSEIREWKKIIPQVIDSLK